MALEGFKVARALGGRAGTASSAKGTLTTTPPAVKALAGRANTSSSARGSLGAGRSLAGRAGSATSATATTLGRLRPIAGRAGSSSSARATTLTIAAYVPTAPPGPLATFRGSVAAVLAGIDPGAAGGVLEAFREAVTMTLSDTVYEVHAGPVDSVTPPAYLLEWADPWTEPVTHCRETAHLEIVCIAARVEPDAGIETLELMVESAIAALSRAGIPHGVTTAPRAFELAGVPYLAARIQVTNTVPIGG